MVQEWKYSHKSVNISTFCLNLVSRSSVLFILFSDKMLPLLNVSLRWFWLCYEDVEYFTLSRCSPCHQIWLQKSSHSFCSHCTWNVKQNRACQNIQLGNLWVQCRCLSLNAQICLHVFLSSPLIPRYGSYFL